jgi:hypothetical protein
MSWVWVKNLRNLYDKQISTILIILGSEMASSANQPENQTR